MLLESIIGVISLFLFFLGSYKYIKDHFNINLFYIPLLVNLVLILLLYFTGLIGILKQTVWIITALAIGYLTYSFIKDFKVILNILKHELQKLQILQKQRGIFYLLLIILISFAISFTLLTIVIQFWAYSKDIQILLLILIALTVFYPLYIVLNKIINLVKIEYFRIIFIVLLFISCIVFFAYLINKDHYIPSIDSIIIRNSGLKNEASDGNEIIFMEIKKSDTGENLKIEENVNWKKITFDNIDGLKSGNLEDYLIFNNPKKGSTGYQFLFVESPYSGIVEITINGETNYYDFYNPNGYNQKIIELTSKNSILDLFVLFSNLVSFVIFLQIIFYYIYTYSIKKNYKFSKYEIVFIFLIIFTILFLSTKSLKFYLWDEFSHWGIFVKELYLKNILPIKNFCTGGPQYIPGISLFGYFFLKNLGYNEGYVYFAYLFFLLTEIITFIGRSQKKIFLYLCLFIAIIVFLFYLPIYFISLYADAAIGLLFGAGLIIGLNVKSDDENKIILFFIFCGLQLIKTWGLILAAILLLMKLHSVFFVKNNKTNKKMKNVLVYLICFCISVIIIQVPWLIHVNKISSEYIGSAIFNIGEWEKSLDIVTEINKKDFFSGFINIFINGRQNFGLEENLAPLKIGILLLTIGIFSSNTKKDLQINIMLFLLYLFDVVLLFFVYLFYFSKYEAINYASFERYLSEFILGWFLFQVSKLAEGEFKINKGNIYSVIKYILFISLIVLCLISNIRIHLPSRNLIGEREDIKYFIEKYDDYLLVQEEPLKIFHIEQDSNGFSHHILRYELCPNLVQYWGWSVGEPYNKKDIFTVNYSVDELRNNLISNFDYVLITEADLKLVEKYKTVFPGIKSSGDQLFIINEDIIPME